MQLSPEGTSLEGVLPRFDVETRKAIHIAAPAKVVYEVARELDMSSSGLIRALFRLRGLPSYALNAEGLARMRFKVVREEPPKGFVLGIIGRFWTISGHLVEFDPHLFSEIQAPGRAKAIWAFNVTPDPAGGSVLSTVTRVLAMDEHARRRFRLYWALVGPFSTVVRSRVLDSIKRSSERLARRVNGRVDP